MVHLARKGAGAERNPIKEDAQLQLLLQQLDAIDSQREFRRWKVSFLERFEEFLQADAVVAAEHAYAAFSTSLGAQSKIVKRMYQYMNQGDLQTEAQGGRVTVMARKCLSDLHYRLEAVIDHLTGMLPATSLEEENLGYSKYHLGAVLIRDGFVEYDRLVICDEILMHLRQACLTEVADRVLLEQLEYYHDRLQMFCDVMADLGLYEAMVKCRQLLYLEDDEDEDEDDSDGDEEGEEWGGGGAAGESNEEGDQEIEIDEFSEASSEKEYVPPPPLPNIAARNTKESPLALGNSGPVAVAEPPAQPPHQQPPKQNMRQKSRNIPLLHEVLNMESCASPPQRRMRTVLPSSPLKKPAPPPIPSMAAAAKKKKKAVGAGLYGNTNNDDSDSDNDNDNKSSSSSSSKMTEYTETSYFNTKPVWEQPKGAQEKTFMNAGAYYHGNPHDWMIARKNSTDNTGAGAGNSGDAGAADNTATDERAATKKTEFAHAKAEREKETAAAAATAAARTKQDAAQAEVTKKAEAAADAEAKAKAKEEEKAIKAAAKAKAKAKEEKEAAKLAAKEEKKKDKKKDKKSSSNGDEDDHDKHHRSKSKDKKDKKHDKKHHHKSHDPTEQNKDERVSHRKTLQPLPNSYPPPAPHKSPTTSSKRSSINKADVPPAIAFPAAHKDEDESDDDEKKASYMPSMGSSSRRRSRQPLEDDVEDLGMESAHGAMITSLPPPSAAAQSQTPSRRIGYDQFGNPTTEDSSVISSQRRRRKKHSSGHKSDKAAAPPQWDAVLGKTDQETGRPKMHRRMSVHSVMDDDDSNDGSSLRQDSLLAPKPTSFVIQRDEEEDDELAYGHDDGIAEDPSVVPLTPSQIKAKQAADAANRSSGRQQSKKSKSEEDSDQTSPTVSSTMEDDNADKTKPVHATDSPKRGPFFKKKDKAQQLLDKKGPPTEVEVQEETMVDGAPDSVNKSSKTPFASHRSKTGLKDYSSLKKKPSSDDDGPASREDASARNRSGLKDYTTGLKDYSKRGGRSINISNEAISAEDNMTKDKQRLDDGKSVVSNDLARKAPKKGLKISMSGPKAPKLNMPPPVVEARVSDKKKEHKSSNKEKAANKKTRPVPLTDDEKALMRKKCYMWYARMGQPDRENMKRRVAALPAHCNIYVEDVDLLPWICHGTVLSIKAMNELFTGDDAD